MWKPAKRFTLFLFTTLIAVSAHAGVIRAQHPIKGQYIVTLNKTLLAPEVRVLAKALAAQHAGTLIYVWESIVPSFAIELPDSAAEALSRNPLVEIVEEDAEWELFQVQSAAPWHLDRADQRYLPLNGTYNHSCNQTDVYAYVLDTGVRSSHREFWMSSVNSTSRVLPGKDFVADGFAANNPCSGDTWDTTRTPCPNDPECIGASHGTAVASVLGGRSYGVSKGVKIIPVRVGNCAGYLDTIWINRGLEWIYNDKPLRNGPAVLNMSMGADMRSVPESSNTASETWINRIVTERNVSVFAAAGNQNIATSNISPARMNRSRGGNVVSVGGSTTTDRRWVCNPSNWFEANECSGNPGSNWGAAVDIFAPSQNIATAHIKQDTGTVWGCCTDSDTRERPADRSGTSFAAPAVAGMAARILIGSGSSLTPLQVWNELLAKATVAPPGVVVLQDNPDANGGFLYGSPNRLLYYPGATRCRL